MQQQFRLLKDKILSKLMLVLTILSVSVVLVIGIGLYYKSVPVLDHSSWYTLLTSSQWKPLKGLFGFFPFIMGTLWVTGIAISIALPLCLLTSLYITEYAPSRIRKILVPFVNLLSGIPPVIFGVWGVLFYYSTDTGSHRPAFCRVFNRIQCIGGRNSFSSNDIPADRKYRLRSIEYYSPGTKRGLTLFRGHQMGNHQKSDRYVKQKRVLLRPRYSLFRALLAKL